jgi:hypothetical protein
LNVNQDVLQNFVSTVGTVGISGGSSTTIQIPYPGICNPWDFIYYPCIQWTSCNAGYNYSLSASNIQVQIVPAAIPFTGNASAQASAGICGINVTASYSPAFNGTLSATWNSGAQQLWFAMQALNVEIYIDLFGNHITLGYVNVASYLPSPLYQMSLPLAGTFPLGAPINKSITVTVQNPTIVLLSGQLQFTANLQFASP